MPATQTDPAVINLTMYRSSPLGRGPAPAAEPNRNEKTKMEIVIDAIIPTASARLIFLCFRDGQTAKTVELSPRIRPPASPHHRTPQKENKIGSGNTAAEPGIRSGILVTNAETIIAMESAIRLKRERSRTDAPAKTDNASVNRSRNPIKTIVGARYLFIAKISIMVAERR